MPAQWSQARRPLTGEGRWGEVARRLAADLESRNRSPGVGWSGEQEYLVAIVHTE